MTVSPSRNTLLHERLNPALHPIYLQTQLDIPPIHQARRTVLLRCVPPQQQQQGKTGLRRWEDAGSTDVASHGVSIRAQTETE